MKNEISSSDVIIDVTNVRVSELDEQTLRLVCASLVVRQYEGQDRSEYFLLATIEKIYKYIKTGELVLPNMYER
jgi:hypothetical protein